MATNKLKSAQTRNKSYKLTLCSPQTQISIKTITKKEFKKLTEQGIGEEEFEELQDELDGEVEFDYPIYEWVEISINDKAIKIDDAVIDKIYQKAKNKFDKENLNSQKTDKRKLKSDDEKYVIVWDRWFKRSFFELTIQEEFDINKLNYEIVSEVMSNGIKYEGYIPFYGDEQIEYSWSHDWNSDDLSIFNSSGESFTIEISEED